MNILASDWACEIARGTLEALHAAGSRETRGVKNG